MLIAGMDRHGSWPTMSSAKRSVIGNRADHGDAGAGDPEAGSIGFRLARPVSHSHPRRLAYLDGWRGLSIIVVLAGHFLGNILLALGHLGVEMFFVLSGRLMAQILFVEQFPLREFYRRRIARILPAMTAFIAISLVVFHYDPYLGARLKLAIASQALVYNFVGAAGHRSPVFDHVWSLCIEEHSYILLAILAWMVRRGRMTLRPALLVIAALSMLDGIFSELVLRQGWFTAYWRTDAHIASIVVSAWLFLTLRDRRPVPAWISPASGVLGISTFANGTPEYLYVTVGTSLLAIAVATLDTTWSGIRAILSMRVLTMAGTLSYSVYLWQQPFYQIAVWKLRLPPGWAVCFLIPAVACGIMSYVLVERPCRRWLNSLDLPMVPRRPVPRATGAVADH